MDELYKKPVRQRVKGTGTPIFLKKRLSYLHSQQRGGPAQRKRYFSKSVNLNRPFEKM